MSDLTKRLRDVVPFQGKSAVAFLCHEAADEIDRLTTQLAEANARVEAITADRPFIMGANHGYEEAMEQAKAEIDEANARADAAFALGLERAIVTMKTTGDSAVTYALGQRLCCSGQDCGCYGATVEDYLAHIIRALSPMPPLPAALQLPEVRAILAKADAAIQAMMTAKSPSEGHYALALANEWRVALIAAGGGE